MKRLIGRLMLFGAMGFILTVALCWWLALQTDRITSPRLSPYGGPGMTGYFETGGTAIWILHPERSAASMRISSVQMHQDPRSGDDTSIAPQWYADTKDIPAWSVIRRGDLRGTRNVFYNEQAFGWPLLALVQCERTEFGANNPQHATDGLGMPASMLNHFGGKSVPLRVVWPGVIVDGAVLGWMCFAVFAFPGVIRRAHRRRKHRCASCGYDLRGVQHLRCPECGETIKKRPIESPPV